MTDAMGMLYALTSKQRDASTSSSKSTAAQKGVERQNAFQRMQSEIAAAKKAQEDSGWLSVVTNVLNSVTDAVVGGNPLQDVLKSVDKALGTKVLEVVYDFVRPDAILNGAVMLASAATGEDKLSQAYDIGSGTSSLQTRFEGAADLSGAPEVMQGYALTRQAIAGAMITVATCGVGTAAMVAIALSTALTVESQLDLLGKAGVKGTTLAALRIGGAVAASVATTGVSIATTGVKTFGELAGRSAVNLITGADKVVRGAVQIGQTLYDHASELHMVESSKYQNVQHQADRQQQRIIGGLREVTKTYQKTLETIAGTWNDQNQTSLMLATRIA